MWVITHTDPDEMLPELLTDEEGSVMTFHDKISAWRYIELMFKEFGVPSSFMDDECIDICRLH